MKLQECFEHIRSAADYLGLAVSSIRPIADGYAVAVIVEVCLPGPLDDASVSNTARQLAAYLSEPLLCFLPSPDRALQKTRDTLPADLRTKKGRAWKAAQQRVTM